MTTSLAVPPLDTGKAGFFRFRRLGKKVLLTNDVGRFALLTPAGFQKFTQGKLRPEDALHKELREKGFIRDFTDFEQMIERWRSSHSFLWQGPSLHIVVVTLRCDHKCVYCQTSSVGMDAAGVDMSEATARSVVDTIFESPSPALTIEFQGGEPLANWPAVRCIVDYSREQARRKGKTLWLNLVTNLSLMDDEKLEFLLSHDVAICTSVDGPASVHDANRIAVGGGSHAVVVRWWKKIRSLTRGKTFGIDALMTTTRKSLSHGKEIVDEYVRLDARGIYLRPLSPYGFVRKTWEAVGYGPDEFLAFYRDTLDYIFALNRKGKNIFETTFRMLATKALKNEDPNFLDLRSPCGAGIGQIAYNYDGSVFTCDEARMLSRMKDDAFRLGHVADGYAAIVNHPTVKALALASCLDNQAECAGCAYLPYCGACPVENYVKQGDLFARTPTGDRCRVYKGIQDYFFEKIGEKGSRKIVDSWTRVPTGQPQRD
ncbi:MAG TPA: His-Xaa-Ser system radical SAM maturase HxsB [Elusimicrobia bacterium]|nr:His-Xaa-Ser system radical SAM maturase HxsB [Elusimicrobiota bacterium]